MTEPFSVQVTAPAWLAEAQAWLTAVVEADGRLLTGPVEQPRVRPWSTQLRAETDAGPVWLKAAAPAMSFEPLLHETLSRLAPDDVDAPLAVDAERGWIVTADRGATLGDAHEPSADDWCTVLATAARLQRRLAGRRDALLATGLPDCSPATVPARLDHLVDTYTALERSHPTHVGDELADQLRTARPWVVDAAERLADGPLPATVQHGDLHPWNVFACDGALRLFDFGDAQWAHAAEVLMVPFGIVRHGGVHDWRTLLGAYADAWEVPVETLDDLLAAAALTHPVNRSLTWWTSLAAATPAQWREYGDAPLHHLRNVLEPWP